MTKEKINISQFQVTKTHLDQSSCVEKFWKKTNGLNRFR